MERKGKGNFRIRKVLLRRFPEQRTAHVGEGSQSFTQKGTMGRLVQLLCRQDTEREETQLGLPKWGGGQSESKLSPLCPHSPRFSAACSKLSLETQPTGLQSPHHNVHIQLLEHCRRLG